MSLPDALKVYRELRNLAAACDNHISHPPPVISHSNTALLDFSSTFAIKLILIALAFLLLSVVPVRAATFSANSNATLVSAINSANGNSEADTINITANITLSAALPTITSAITINGNSRSISGNDLVRVFFVQTTSGDLTLNNITVKEGDQSGQGGTGGAIIVFAGSLTLNQVSVRDSAANEGGGIYATNGATLTINRSAIHGNTAGESGGGIYGETATVTIYNSSIFGNIASSRGGGIYSSSAQGVIKLYHVTITGNTASVNASVKGDGIRISGSTLTLRNSIIYGNTNQNCQINASATVSVNSNNIIGGGSSASCSANQSSANPLLSSNPTGSPPYYAFREDSPARDAATCISGVTVDQRGVTRPQESSCDIGAYEWYPPPPLLQRQPNEGAPSGSSDEESSAVDDSYTPPPPSTCLTLDGIVASNISESTQCQRVNAMQIANPAFPAGSFADAVDVWGWVTPNSEICFEAQGSAIKFIDTTAMPRATTDLIAYSRQDTVCASIDGPGILVLLPGDAPAAGSGQAGTASSASRGLSDCMVTLTEKLNFRETPGGEIMEVLSKDFKLTAEERTDDWFKVDFWGEKGWISAEWVAPEGDCG